MMNNTVAITMRHENKYICSEKQMFILENRLKSFLPKDINQSDNFYSIRSLYFDTVNDRMLCESLQGIEKRSKFRIRTYNHSKDISRLEKKISVNNLKTKKSIILDSAEVENIISGGEIRFDGNGNLRDEFYYLQKSEGLAPKIIVEYDRTAFVYDIGNVRITFDKNIRASGEIADFYSESILGYTVQSDNRGVLEVKYDGILPGFIVNILNIGNLQQVSFSKYSLCRNILENNGRIEEYYEL